jgi:methylated-DNA-protein-cysteine methyltransferase related protein
VRSRLDSEARPPHNGGKRLNVMSTHDGLAPDNFTFRAAELIRSIPKGKVATYGQIAGMAGDPRGARQVVRVLNTQKNLPWHRALAAGGRITLPGPGGALQRKLLEAEGVRFNADGTTPLAIYGWQGDVQANQR